MESSLVRIAFFVAVLAVTASCSARAEALAALLGATPYQPEGAAQEEAEGEDERPYGAVAAGRRQRTEAARPYRLEEHTAGVLSVESLAKTYSMKVARDEALDTYVLANEHDRLVFVPNMGRVEANGISLLLPIRPFYQGDRLYVPVEAVNFLRSPLPEYDQIPAVIRKRLSLSKVGLRSVFIDPGHGGHDPGALGLRGAREKDINLDIALRLARLLEAQGVKVTLSRTGDYFVGLHERAAMAARSGAEVFVSIHSNSSPDRSVAGVETYYSRNGYASALLAEAFQRTLGQNLGVPDRGIKPANFAVLRSNVLPAVLVEVGFLSNWDNEALLRQTFYRDRIAGMMVEALAVYSQVRGRSGR